MSKPSKIIAVDFDGTLVENGTHPGERYPGFGEAKRDVIAKLLMHQRAGAKIILWTCREGEALQMAVDFCEEQGIRLDAVNENLNEWTKFSGHNSRKIFATVYLDDRASSIQEFLEN